MLAKCEIIRTLQYNKPDEYLNHLNNPKFI